MTCDVLSSLVFFPCPHMVKTEVGLHVVHLVGHAANTRERQSSWHKFLCCCNLKKANHQTALPDVSQNSFLRVGSSCIFFFILLSEEGDTSSKV